jgi:hypothetical protein
MVYTGGNHIHAGGVEQLVKGDWKKLTWLNLRENYIGSEGAWHFSRADWPELK